MTEATIEDYRAGVIKNVRGIMYFDDACNGIVPSDLRILIGEIDRLRAALRQAEVSASPDREALAQTLREIAPYLVSHMMPIYAAKVCEAADALCQPQVTPSPRAPSGHGALPWRLRPNKHDDWGWIRDAHGHVACQVRWSPELTEDDLNKHRRDKTDPAQEVADFILAKVNASSPSPSSGEPVAWQVKDYADGWTTYAYEDVARKLAAELGAAIRPLYASPAPAAAPTLGREAFIRVLASLAAAISLLERGGKAAKKAAASDKIFDQMLVDYKAALEAGRATILARSVAVTTEPLTKFVRDHWDDQDMNHADFRVKAFEIASDKDTTA